MKKIKYAGTNEVVYYEKLSNGLEVYMYPSDTARNFYLTFNTKFGSLYTKYKKNGKIVNLPNGTAHFLEHQMFQDDDGPVFSKFAALGSSVNAFTTYNLTCYEVVASDHFKENLELLINFVQNPYFKAQSIQNEKGIIKEEIEMYDDNPDARIVYGTEFNLNHKDNHKYLISGTKEDIKEIKESTLYEAYNDFYHPSNMFMVLTGKFKPLEVLGIIKEIENKKDFAKRDSISIIKPKEPEEVCVPFEEIKLDVSLPKIKISYKIPKRLFKGYSDLLLKIYIHAILKIKFGSTSDLLEKMVNENLILWDISLGKDIRDSYIYISVYVESEYKDEVISLIREELKNIKITKEDLGRIKKVSISNFIRHFDNIISVCEDIQDDIVNHNGIQYKIMDIYKELNLNDMNDIASKLYSKNECIYIIDKKE